MSTIHSALCPAQLFCLTNRENLHIHFITTHNSNGQIQAKDMGTKNIQTLTYIHRHHQHQRKDDERRLLWAVPGKVQQQLLSLPASLCLIMWLLDIAGRRVHPMDELVLHPLQITPDPQQHHSQHHTKGCTGHHSSWVAGTYYPL